MSTFSQMSVPILELTRKAYQSYIGILEYNKIVSSMVDCEIVVFGQEQPIGSELLHHCKVMKLVPKNPDFEIAVLKELISEIDNQLKKEDHE